MKSDKRVPFDAREMLVQFAGYEFGEGRVGELRLCSMTARGHAAKADAEHAAAADADAVDEESTADDGFYETIARLKLP